MSVAFIVAVIKGKRPLAWGGTGCDALDNACALLFLFSCACFKETQPECKTFLTTSLSLGGLVRGELPTRWGKEETEPTAFGAFWVAD